MKNTRGRLSWNPLPCPACAGSVGLLGILGNLVRWRCEECGETRLEALIGLDTEQDKA